MRRHPVAVYRIIDEEELLGSDDFDLDSRRPVPGSDAPRRALRLQEGRWNGWGSTTLGVVVLAGVAGLLLAVSPGVHAPVPLSSPHRGTATRAGRVLRVVVPAGLAAPARPLPRPLPARTPRVIARRRRRLRERRLVVTETRQSVVVAASGGAGSMTPPPASAPNREFGFER